MISYSLFKIKLNMINPIIIKYFIIIIFILYKIKLNQIKTRFNFLNDHTTMVTITNNIYLFSTIKSIFCLFVCP